jgi:hypothetical protein
MEGDVMEKCTWTKHEALKAFRARMIREGRGDELKAQIHAERRSREAAGKSPDSMMAEVCVARRMGYVNRADEWRIHMESGGGEVLKETFEDAVAGLPDKAPAQANLDWIQSHPAMSRKARMKNNLESVLISPGDILHAPHGKAPSKAAVYALQHWANNPSEFFKQMLGEQKKRAESDEGSTVEEADPGIAEVEALLRQVTGAVPQEA